MSKICILGLANIRHISLISLYTEYLDAHGIPYDLIYIDRYGTEEKTTAAHQYAFRAQPAKSRLQKLGSFLRFRRYALGLIRKNKYEKIITWQTNGAYLFADVLLRRFKGRYVVNVRDYIMEEMPLIRPLIRRLVKHAAFTAISSAGFKVFLPEGEYVQVNSVNEQLLTDAPRRDAAPQVPYKIGFVGNCRFFRENFRLIDALANDDRFELWYCGTSSEVLAQYAEEKGIRNVFTQPGFRREETTEIMSRFDLINSAFGSDAMDNRTLMPIRLYTALEMHIPVLVSGGSFLAEQVEAHRLGFVLDGEANLGDRLAAYLEAQDPAQLRADCDRYMETARAENEHFYDTLGKFVGV